MDLLKTLYHEGFIKVGDYKLKSGQKSPLYFDFRSLISNYDLFDRVTDRLLSLIEDEFTPTDYYTNKNNIDTAKKNFQYLCGVPYGGISFASILNDKFHRESPGWFGIMMARKKRKDHGLGGYIFGLKDSDKSPKVILVEDVITTGMSIYETIQELEKENCQIVGVISIFDRHQKVEGFEFPRDKYPIKSLFQPRDLFPILKIMTSQEKDYLWPYLTEIIPSKRSYFNLLNLIEKKKSNLVVAADHFDRPEEIITYLKINASKIIILKLHLDTLEFSDQLTEAKFWEQIKELKKRYSFWVMEDAKIADISKIALKKLKRINLYHGIDLVTIHGLNAPALLKALPNDYQGPKLVIVSDMSSDTIWDSVGDFHEQDYKEQYRLSCLSLSNTSNHLLGFVTQKPEAEFGMIYMTPGISITVQNEADQHYQTPETVVQKGSHLIIVGSGITKYNHVMDDLTSKYQRRGFQAYQSKFLK